MILTVLDSLSQEHVKHLSSCKPYFMSLCSVWFLFAIQIAVACTILIPLGVHSDEARKLNV